MEKKVFLISPVRHLPNGEVRGRMTEYIQILKVRGYTVYWPLRDTKQNDLIGLDICLQNARAIRDADEIHIWYDPASEGSIFDLGMAFMASLVAGPPKRFVIANPDDVTPTSDKSFQNILLALAAGK